jgi:Tol biopolymer transport system component
MSLLSELKRRNVLRTALAYLAGSWLLIQIAETVFPLFGLPDSSARLVVVVLGVVFVPVLVISWVFQWSPQGLVKDQGTLSDGSDVARQAKAADRVMMIVMALALGYFAFDKFVFDPPPPPPPPPVREKPLTTMEGFERHPAFSPDGNNVAFVWEEIENDSPGNIYVVPVTGGEPVQFTNTEAHEDSPTWSPDGTQLAFLRFREDDKQWDLIVKPLLGGPETHVATVQHWGIDWSPDGKLLAYRARESAPSTPGHAEERINIYLFSMASGERKRFTRSSSNEATGDNGPLFSPDGQTLAFTRYISGSGSGGYICVQRLEESEARCFEHTHGVIFDSAWTPDSENVVFVTTTGLTGETELIRVAISDGELTPLHFGNGADDLAIARRRSVLVYSHRFEDHNLWRVPGPTATGPPVPEKFISSTRDDFHPTYSPDGSQIAFISARSGAWEIWVAQADGSNPRQLTNMLHAMFPDWSPDGQQILFSSAGFADGIPEGEIISYVSNMSDVYAINVSGGFPENHTEDQHDDAVPAWSADGDWIYYQSRSEQCGWQLWKKQLDGGHAEQLASCMLRPLAGPDGRIYYHDKKTDGIASISTNGGESRIELEDVSFIAWRFWEGNIVYFDRAGESINMLNLETSETRQLASVDGGTSSFRSMSLTVSPDGQWIVYTHIDRAGSDLMIVDPAPF